MRGVGLAWGVELVDAGTRAGRCASDGVATDARSGSLVGTTGRHGNVLKIRPPLAFDDRHVPVLAGALEAALDATAA